MVLGEEKQYFPPFFHQRGSGSVDGLLLLGHEKPIKVAADEVAEHDAEVE